MGYSIINTVRKTISFINLYFNLKFFKKMSSKKDNNVTFETLTKQGQTIDDFDHSRSSTCYINQLPLEVLIYMMEFLTYADRLVARQVCQHWFKASTTPEFLDGEKIVISTEFTLEALSVLQNTFRPYYHIVMIGIEISNDVKDLLLKLAPTLRSLYIKECSMYEKSLIDILSSCFRLETLVLEDCQEVFMPGTFFSSPEEVAVLQKSLGRLRELQVSFNRYLSDAVFIRIMNTIPYLEAISLQGCPISYHKALLGKYYPKKSLSAHIELPSETVFTFWIVYSILSRRASVVKSLNLSNTLLDSNSLKSLSTLEDLKLKELHIAGCRELTNEGVVALALHQKSLTVLDITNCSRVTDLAFLKICKNLTNLKKLLVSNCRTITDLGMAQLKKLVHLEELDVSFCDNISGEGILKGLCKRVNRTMRKLHMDNLHELTSDTLSLLAEKLPDLTVLSLNICPNAVTDNSVQAIFQHQVRLRSLRLTFGYRVTDIGFTGMGTDKELKTVVSAVDHLALSQPNLRISLRSKAEEDIVRDAHKQKRVQEMCEAQLSRSGNVGYALVRLKGLQILDLEHCYGLTDISLKHSFKFTELNRLNLSYCHQITDSGLRAVALNNPSINTLSLVECLNVTDVGIEAITSLLHRLSSLNISFCYKLTAASVMSIVNNCYLLRHLDAFHCPNMIDKLQEMLPRLPTHTYFLSSSDDDDDDEDLIPPPPPFPY